MKLTPLLAAVLPLALFWLAGCETRSISNSGFPSARSGAIDATGYRGELSELDVIGLVPDAAITEADIQAAAQSGQPPRLRPSSRVLLIQSGADLPDGTMIAAMQRQFAVDTFSGKPPASIANAAPQSFSKTLPLVAARGGYDKILCYWGVLESAREDKATAAISWVPIVGYLIPDEREHMRIRLKAALIDVETGGWTFVTPPAVSFSQLSTVLSRREVDQRLVEKLKAEGYEQLVATLRREHTSPTRS